MILVSPKGAGNVGAAARAMANMGLSDLRLVRPRCDPRSEEARRFAVHATAVLSSLRVHPSLEEAASDCDLVIGTSHRPRTEVSEVLGLEGLRPLLAASRRTALVFGPEESGLGNHDLALCQRTLCLPTAGYSSLNLAQAVLLSCYELRRQELEETLPPERQLAEHGALEGFYRQLGDYLLEIGFTDAVRLERTLNAFRLLLNRAQPDSRELAMLRGLLSQSHWALGRPRPPAGSGSPEEGR